MTDWATKQCKPCEGGVPAIDADTARRELGGLDGWSLSDGGDAIERSVNTGDFLSAVRLIERVAAIAEREQHHPDLHLTGYRHLRIVLTTHAIGGLSENDFIVAAKLDPVLG